VRRIDLNADMGESFGLWRIGADEALMPYITSANVACGAHAGDPSVMWATVRLARWHGVAVGAHPGYADLQGFGRRSIQMTPDEVAGLVLYQLGALWAIARAEGVELRHVKPHGALYNSASSDRQLAEAIAQAVWRFSTSLPLVCLADSQMERAARDVGLPVAREGFADRAYEPTGLLASRSTPGSLLSSPADAASQAVGLASGKVIARDGTELSLHVDTICIHSDTPGAAEIARSVRAALTGAGYEVSPFQLHG